MGIGLIMSGLGQGIAQAGQTFGNAAINNRRRVEIVVTLVQVFTQRRGPSVGIWNITAFSRSFSRSCSVTRAGFAPVRSSLLMNASRGTL